MSNRIECVYVESDGLTGLKRWLDTETGKCYLDHDSEDDDHANSGFKLKVHGCYTDGICKLKPVNEVTPNKTVSKVDHKKIMLDIMKILVENGYYEEAYEILSILQSIKDKEKQNA